MAAIASTSRLRLSLPCLCRSLVQQRSFVNHTPITYPIVERIPPQKEPLTTVAAVLKAAGRGVEEHADKFETWEDLFGSTGDKLEEKGLSVRDRKHLMRSLQWYRLGFHPADLVVPKKPAKKFRGHGTKIQKGKFVPERYLFRGKHRRSRRMPKDIRKRWIPLDSPLRADKIVRKKGRRYEVQAMTHTYSPAEFKALLGEVDGKGRASPNPPRPAEAKVKAGKLEYKA